MSEDTTTVEVSIGTYQNLGSRKKPSESFDDVIARCLLERDRLEDDLNEIDGRLSQLEDVLSSNFNDEMSERAALSLVQEMNEAVEPSDNISKEDKQ